MFKNRLVKNMMQKRCPVKGGAL